MKEAKGFSEQPSEQPLERVAFSLGSNLGNRRANLEMGVRSLSDVVRTIAVSSVYETPPEEGSEPPAYLNLVVVGETRLSPDAILAAIARIEAEAGRVRHRRNAARTLDVDIVLYGSRIVDSEGLTIPHPRYSNRPFVLAPLAEVWPDAIDPRSGRTASGMWLRVAESGPRIEVLSPSDRSETEWNPPGGEPE